MIYWIICTVLSHKLLQKDKSLDGELEKVCCSRCKRTFALFHPVEYFGEWDWEDERMLKNFKSWEVKK